MADWRQVVGLGRKRASDWLSKNTRATSRAKGSAGANDDEWSHPDLDWKCVVGRSKKDVHARFRQFIRAVIDAEESAAPPPPAPTLLRPPAEKKALEEEFPSLKNRGMVEGLAFHIMDFLEFQEEAAQHHGEVMDDGWSGMEIASYMFEKEDAPNTVTREEAALVEAALEYLLAEMPNEVHSRGGHNPLAALWVLTSDGEPRANPGRRGRRRRQNPFVRWTSDMRAAEGTTEEFVPGLNSYGADIGYFGIVLWMSPQSFLKAAQTLYSPREGTQDFLERSKVPWGYPQLTFTTDGLQPVDHPHWKAPRNLPPLPPQKFRVQWHEGRHRATHAKNVLRKELIPVAILVLGTPSYRARHFTDDIILQLATKTISAEEGVPTRLKAKYVWKSGVIREILPGGRFGASTTVALEDALQLF